MNRNIQSHTVTRVARGFIAATALFAMAACQGEPMAPKGAAEVTNAGAPAYAKGGNGTGGKAQTFSVRAYGIVHPGYYGSSPTVTGANVTGVTKLGVGRYCLKLSPEVFPDPASVFGMVAPHNSSGTATWVGTYGACSDGVEIQTLTGEGFAQDGTLFSFIVL
jgi:hypothetical protein